MLAPNFTRTLESLDEVATRLDLVLIPGFKNSGPEHWQSLWQDHSPAFQRISHSHWNAPDIEHWIDATRRLLAQRQRPSILIGHSLGALAATCLAAELHPLVAGVMLVAPPRPSRFEAVERVPHTRLEIPAMVVASQTDPIMPFSRAEHWSHLWGAELVDIGDAGHINAEAGYGLWWQGLELLLRFERRMRH